MSITITGIDELERKLGANFIDILEPPMNRSVLRLEAYMKEYPPAPARSFYVRTGNLGRRWTHSVTRNTDSLIGKAGNNTIYGPYVQSQQFQKRIFQRIGWRTDQSAIDTLENDIRADFEQSIREALAK